MGLLDDITLGRYVPGDSFLHRLDARLKLCGLPLFIVAAFAAPEPGRLFGLAGCALAMLLLAQIPWRIWWRGIRIFRWLFLFTLLLHLLLTPGRTLFGVEWLSYDGLLRGSTVCAQLLLAIIFSSLLTLTSTVEALAAAVSSLLAPLRRFRVPVDELSWLLQQVLHFIPVLREECAVQIEAFRCRGEDLAHGSLLQRGRVAGRMLAPLMLGLVDRADTLAHEVAGGRQKMADAASIAQPPLSAQDMGLAAAGLLALALIWGFL
ncbi:energy-coupling factor transporter transmembrane component T family protein [Trichloromonas sp.]|uniref:energy-coupling factor transporter transmembrane component T family protein n=1 Tax=Trichloromonas sp. TaxID=3069249 RepID=UPI003D81A797